MSDPRMKITIPPETAGHWDAKKDDVWAFGCIVYFLFNCNPPVPSSLNLRQLFRVHSKNQVPDDVVRNTPKFSNETKEFLVWILNPDQRQRPSMNQVMMHPWLQTGNPTSPSSVPHLSSNPDVYAKTFRQVAKPIHPNLIKEMAQEGYAIEHKLGQGGFGAVYK